MKMRYCLALSVVGFLFISIAAVRAAEDAKPTAEQAAANRAEFDKVYEEAKEIVRQRTEVSERFPQADDEQKKVLQDKFNDLNARAFKLRPRFNTLAEKVYLADPTNKEVAQYLISAIQNTMEADEYEESLRLAKLAIDHNIPAPGLYFLYFMAGKAAFYVADFDDAEKYLTRAKTEAEAAIQQALAAKSIDEANIKRTSEAKLIEECGHYLAELPSQRTKWAREVELRKAEDKAGDLPIVKLVIVDGDGKVKGTIRVELFENEAPNTVANFVNLVNNKKYDGVKFHRVIHEFMAQGGDPKGDGSGGPGYRIADECHQENHREHFRGSLSMAHTSEPDSGGSQFFMNFVPKAELDGQYTVFGRVIEGMDVLALIQRIDPERPSYGLHADRIQKATVERKRAHAYVPKTLP